MNGNKRPHNQQPHQAQKNTQLKGIEMTIIKKIENWFKAAVPNPTDDNRRVQLGCHLE